MDLSSLILASSVGTNVLLLSSMLNELKNKQKDKGHLSIIGKELGKLSQLVALTQESDTYIEQLELSTLLFKQSGDSILIANPSGIVIEANPAFYRATGYSPETTIGKPLGFCTSSHDSNSKFSQYIEEALVDGVSIKELFTQRENGTIFPELITVSPVVKDGHVENIVVFSRDISEQKEREGRLIREAKKDKLTGVFNRDGFESRLKAAIETQGEGGGHQVGVLFLDLDEFKPVNDTYGHDVGDQLLMGVANRISNSCEEIDTVARLGGDEFVCVFPLVQDKTELEFRAKKVLASLGAPIAIEGMQLPVKCSIGAALYPEDAATIDELIKASDVAMYQAKTAGKNQIRLYDAAFKSQDQEFEELSVKLEDAARNNKLNLAFHPVYTSSGEVYYYDVLLRWFTEDGNEVSPAKFIQVAEKYDIMDELYDFTLRSLAFNKTVKQHFDEGILFSIKLEEKAIKSDVFAQTFLSKMKKLSLPVSKIIVRVDESVVAANFKASLSNINYLEDNEVKVCLDDFCIGNFSILNRVNLRSTLAKLPRELIRELTENHNKVHILNSIFALADAMNTVVVVEGVEDERSLKLFLDHGVEFVQGNFLGKAILDSNLPKSHMELNLKNY